MSHSSILLPQTSYPHHIGVHMGWPTDLLPECKYRYWERILRDQPRFHTRWAGCGGQNQQEDIDQDNGSTFAVHNLR